MNNDQSKLKLYAPKSLVSPKIHYSPLVYPFWGVVRRKETPYVSAVFARHNFDSQYYTLAEDVREADFVFPPHNYWLLRQRDPVLLRHYLRVAHQYKKPILIDAYGDSMELVKIPQSIVLRLAQYRSRLQKNEIIIPTYTEDLLESYCGGILRLREKSETPSIGFTGWSKLPFLKYPRTFLKDLPLRAVSFLNPKYGIFRKGVFLRQEMFKAFEHSSLIVPHFQLRDFYSGHVSTAKADFKTLRREFIENILGSDYTLCVRGDANASTRFYEVLSLERIPILVNTACVLPLENLIDYRKFCLFVEYADVTRLPEIVAQFHKSLSEDDFVDMQQKAREAFATHLRIDRFTPYLVRELKRIAFGRKVAA